MKMPKKSLSMKWRKLILLALILIRLGMSTSVAAVINIQNKKSHVTSLIVLQGWRRKEKNHSTPKQKKII